MWKAKKVEKTKQNKQNKNGGGKVKVWKGGKENKTRVPVRRTSSGEKKGIPDHIFFLFVVLEREKGGNRRRE